MANDAQTPAGGATRGRLLAGAGVLIFGWLCPLLVPLVLMSGWPDGWKTAISGLLMLGIPELFTLAAAAILGKPGFDYLRQRAFAWLRRVAPPDQVGSTRYRLGLVLFLIPILFGWASVYVSDVIPGFENHTLAFAVAGDLMLLASLLVLGGEFWDKLRALFVHGARARFPAAGG